MYIVHITGTLNVAEDIIIFIECIYYMMIAAHVAPYVCRLGGEGVQ